MRTAVNLEWSINELRTHQKQIRRLVKELVFAERITPHSEIADAFLRFDHAVYLLTEELLAELGNQAPLPGISEDPTIRVGSSGGSHLSQTTK
jgi:hypothetical protein